MRITDSNRLTYVSPKIKAVQLDFQAVLAASGNPSITNPPMQWETNGNPSISNPSMPWESQKHDTPWESGDAE